MAGHHTTIYPVVSSNLAGAGWASFNNGYMEVEFLSGSLYFYRYVPWNAFLALMNAPSKGKHFWAYVRKTGMYADPFHPDHLISGAPYPYGRIR